MTSNPKRINRWDLGSSYAARVQRRPDMAGMDIYDPATWSRGLNSQLSDDQAAYAASKRRWGIADKIATGVALGGLSAGVGAAFGAPALVGGSGSTMNGLPLVPYSSMSASMVPSAAGAATGVAGKMATLGKIFSSPGMELGVNSVLNLYGQHKASKAADQARADQLAQYRESLALERQRLELEARNADLDRADAKALNDAINALKKQELDAMEEERAFNRGLVESREQRLTPYRNISESALKRLASMWSLN